MGIFNIDSLIKENVDLNDKLAKSNTSSLKNLIELSSMKKELSYSQQKSKKLYHENISLKKQLLTLDKKRINNLKLTYFITGLFIIILLLII